MEDRARNAALARGQETIVMSSESRYLETLKEMLRAAEARNDPTLAIAVSPRMLRLLLTAAGVLTPERPAEWHTPRGDTIEEVVTDATGQVIERYGSALQKLAERPAGEAGT